LVINTTVLRCVIKPDETNEPPIAWSFMTCSTISTPGNDTEEIAITVRMLQYEFQSTDQIIVGLWCYGTRPCHTESGLG